jgi:hypothetical protein
MGFFGGGCPRQWVGFGRENGNHETHEISRKSKEWELGRRLCRSRFFRAVFVSFVVSWMEEITAEAQRPRRDAKEEGFFGSFGGIEDF